MSGQYGSDLLDPGREQEIASWDTLMAAQAPSYEPPPVPEDIYATGAADPSYAPAQDLSYSEPYYGDQNMTPAYTEPTYGAAPEAPAYAEPMQDPFQQMMYAPAQEMGYQPAPTDPWSQMGYQPDLSREMQGADQFFPWAPEATPEDLAQAEGLQGYLAGEEVAPEWYASKGLYYGGPPIFSRDLLDSWESPQNFTQDEWFSTVNGDDIGGRMPPARMNLNRDIPLDPSQIQDVRAFGEAGSYAPMNPDFLATMGDRTKDVAELFLDKLGINPFKRTMPDWAGPAANPVDPNTGLPLDPSLYAQFGFGATGYPQTSTNQKPFFNNPQFAESNAQFDYTTNPENRNSASIASGIWNFANDALGAGQDVIGDVAQTAGNYLNPYGWNAPTASGYAGGRSREDNIVGDIARFTAEAQVPGSVPDAALLAFSDPLFEALGPAYRALRNPATREGLGDFAGRVPSFLENPAALGGDLVNIPRIFPAAEAARYPEGVILRGGGAADDASKFLDEVIQSNPGRIANDIAAMRAQNIPDNTIVDFLSQQTNDIGKAARAIGQQVDEAPQLPLGNVDDLKSQLRQDLGIADQPSHTVVRSVDDLPSAPDVVSGPAEMYHGTGARFEAYDESLLDGTALYGPGVYLTDDADIAASYARNRAKKLGAESGALQRVSVPEGSRLINLEKALPQDAANEIRRIADQQSAGWDAQAWADAADAVNAGKPGKEVYSAFKSGLMDDGATMSDAAEALDALNQAFRGLGYDGLAHTGGEARGGKRHLVNILFDPEKAKISSAEDIARIRKTPDQIAETAGKLDPAPGEKFPTGTVRSAADDPVDVAEREFARVTDYGPAPVYGEQAALPLNLGAADDTRGSWDKFVDEAAAAASLPRSVLASFDLSAPGRQGLALAFRHPKEWGQSWKPMWTAWKNADAAEAIARDIGSINARVKSMVGTQDDLIHLYEVGPDAKGLNKVPGFEGIGKGKISGAIGKVDDALGNPLGRSERAYATFLNYQKSKTFETMATAMHQAGERNLDAYKRLGEVIDHATGFGAAPLTGRLEGQAFFSQRYMTSRFQFLTDPIVEALIKRDMNAARAATENLVAFTGGLGGILALIDATGTANVEWDPRSTDFGKIRIGPQRIDFGAGFLPLIRTLSREVTGEAKASTGAVYDTSRIKEPLKFLRNKLAPIPSEAISRILGEDPVGNPNPPILSFNTLANMFAPLIAQSTVEAFKQTGSPVAAGRAAVSELFGGGTSTYGTGQAQQIDLAQNVYGKEYDSLASTQQASLNAYIVEQGGDLPYRNRQAPWWQARDDALTDWAASIDPKTLEDPFSQKALSIKDSGYVDLQPELVKWAEDAYSLPRDEAEAAVEKFLTSTGLDDQVKKYREYVLEQDPGFAKSWLDAYNNYEKDVYEPPKWIKDIAKGK